MDAPCLLAQDLVVAGMLPMQAIDLSVQAGEVVLIQAPAGTGLTALARTLLGLQSPQAGRVALLGQDLALLAERQLLPLRLRAAYLPPVEGAGLLPAWTGFDNLALSWLQHAQGKSISAQGLQAELAAEARRYGIPASWLLEPVTRRSRPERLALGLWRLLRSRPEFIVLEEWVLLSGMVSELRLDVLLADALAVEPAILVLTSDAAYCLPTALSKGRVRQAAIHKGMLQWSNPSAQGSGDV